MLVLNSDLQRGQTAQCLEVLTESVLEIQIPCIR